MSIFNMMMRARWLAILVVLGSASAANASFLSNSPDPFAVGNRLLGADSCVTSGALAGVCTSNNQTTILSSNVSFPGDGNEYEVVTANLSGDLSGGLGSYFLTGVYDFTLFGRSVAGPGSFLGTFALQETYVNLQGDVSGTPLTLELDPSKTSVGAASITAAGSKYLIDVNLIVNGLFYLDEQPVPVSSALTGAAAAVPEPSVWLMMLLGFGLTGAMLRHRVSLAKRNAISAA